MNDWPSARTPINMNRDLREGSLSRERPPERERREGAPPWRLRTRLRMLEAYVPRQSKREKREGVVGRAWRA